MGFPFEQGMTPPARRDFLSLSLPAAVAVSDFCRLRPASLLLCPDKRFRASPSLFASSVPLFFRRMFVEVLRCCRRFSGHSGHNCEQKRHLPAVVELISGCRRRTGNRRNSKSIQNARWDACLETRSTQKGGTGLDMRAEV